MLYDDALCLVCCVVVQYVVWLYVMVRCDVWRLVMSCCCMHGQWYILLVYALMLLYDVWWCMVTVRMFYYACWRMLMQWCAVVYGVMCGDVCWCVIICDDVWSCMIIYGDVYCDISWYMMAYGDMRWFVMMYGDALYVVVCVMVNGDVRWRMVMWCHVWWWYVVFDGMHVCRWVKLCIMLCYMWMLWCRVW